MTFFDRKVDLAQFDEDTPLYVMCREWMRNNPADSVGGAHVPALQEADGEQTQVRWCSSIIVHALLIGSCACMHACVLKILSFVAIRMGMGISKIADGDEYFE